MRVLIILVALLALSGCATVATVATPETGLQLDEGETYLLADSRSLPGTFGFCDMPSDQFNTEVHVQRGAPRMCHSKFFGVSFKARNHPGGASVWEVGPDSAYGEGATTLKADGRNYHLFKVKPGRFALASVTIYAEQGRFSVFGALNKSARDVTLEAGKINYFPGLFRGVIAFQKGERARKREIVQDVKAKNLDLAAENAEINARISERPLSYPTTALSDEAAQKQIADAQAALRSVGGDVAARRLVAKKPEPMLVQCKERKKSTAEAVVGWFIGVRGKVSACRFEKE